MMYVKISFLLIYLEPFVSNPIIRQPGATRTPTKSSLFVGKSSRKQPSCVCYLWKPCSVSILIVTATEETVITSRITNDQRFPAGLGVKGAQPVPAA